VDDDNNGLWTAIVAAAELFRHAVTKVERAVREPLESRQRAFRHAVTKV
jgi:hypothetical protein